MTNRSKAKGSAWETCIVDFLRGHGRPHVERRALGGANDRGDIAGIPGVVIEAKNAKQINLAGWVDEAQVEAANDQADVGVVWIKRRGHLSPGNGYVVMTGDDFIALLDQAGY